MRCSAALACRSPPRLRRRYWRRPEERSTGLTPHSAARLRPDRQAAPSTSNRKPIGLPPGGVPLLDLDVTGDASATAVVQQVIDQFGRIDVLVNNAGMGLMGAAEENSLAQAQVVFDVNVFGVMRMVKEVLPHIRARRRGRIINLSSVVGFLPSPYMAVYSASKHAAAELDRQEWVIARRRVGTVLTPDRRTAEADDIEDPQDTDTAQPVDGRVVVGQRHRPLSRAGGDRPGGLADRDHHVGLGGGDLPGPTTPDGRRGYIGFMCTRPRARRRGHGGEVLGSLIEWLTTRGVARRRRRAARISSSAALSSRSVRSWVVSVEAWPSRRRTARGHARRCLPRGGKPNRDEETAGGAGCEVEGPVVCSDDAVHDGQPEADAGVLIGADALCSALEGFGEGRY
jgi:NAD(P)-dependent dehydrogenase (short-subunit alcohol dehydrogenase family)